MAIVCVMADLLINKIKLTENAIILRYNFSLSDLHFFLIFLEGEILLPTVRAQLEHWACLVLSVLFLLDPDRILLINLYSKS